MPENKENNRLGQDEIFGIFYKEPELKDLVSCVERELRMRINAYPKLIIAKKISIHKANYEIHVMKHVLINLQEQSQNKRF